MPGHDEDDVRRARQDEMSGPRSDDDQTFEGGLSETGMSGEDGDFVGTVTGGTGEFDDEQEFGESGMGGVGGTGMTDAEHGSGAQSRMTTGIGAAGDQTDEEILEDR